MDKLTPKQQRFCEEYLIDLNATQAAIRAGYSEKTAQEIGSENLSKPMIRKCVDQAMAERSEKTSIDAAYVLRECKWLYDQAKTELQAEFCPRALAGANKSLEMVGKHVNVQAFNERVTLETPNVAINYIVPDGHSANTTAA